MCVCAVLSVQLQLAARTRRRRRGGAGELYLHAGLSGERVARAAATRSSPRQARSLYLLGGLQFV